MIAKSDLFELAFMCVRSLITAYRFSFHASNAFFPRVKCNVLQKISIFKFNLVKYTTYYSTTASTAGKISSRSSSKIVTKWAHSRSACIV